MNYVIKILCVSICFSSGMLAMDPLRPLDELPSSNLPSTTLRTGRTGRAGSSQTSHEASSGTAGSDSAEATSDRQAADLGTKLISVARSGNLKQLQELIKAKADINSRDDFGMTSLMYAARNNHCSCLQSLIEAKANINSKDDIKSNALHCAANAGCHLCIQSLIASKAQINCQSVYRQTPLFRAVVCNNIPCVQILLDAQAQVNCGKNPLIVAANNGAQNMCEILVEALIKTPNNAQKKSMFAILNCSTKRKKGFFKKYMVPKEITHQIVKYMLEACEQKNRTNFAKSIAYDKVSKIWNKSIKKALLEKYYPQQQESNCSIQ